MLSKTLYLFIYLFTNYYLGYKFLKTDVPNGSKTQKSGETELVCWTERIKTLLECGNQHGVLEYRIIDGASTNITSLVDNYEKFYIFMASSGKTTLVITIYLPHE